MRTLSHLYQKILPLFTYGQSVFLFVIRVYWGVQLAQSGWGKLHHLDMVTGYFQSINVPAPAATAHMVAVLEFVGGILLITGFASRAISAVLTVNLFAAYWYGDHEAFLAFFSNPDKFTAAAPFQFLLVSLIVLLFGAGYISVDALIQKLRKESPPLRKKQAV